MLQETNPHFELGGLHRHKSAATTQSNLMSLSVDRPECVNSFPGSLQGWPKFCASRNRLYATTSWHHPNFYLYSS